MWEGTDWRWRLEWRRDRFQWETEIEGNLMECIASTSVKRDMEDVQVWGDELSDEFTVNATYVSLTKQTRGTRQDALELVWKMKAFPNVLVTAWRVLIDRIPTREGLCRRRVQMNSTVCVMCMTQVETCQHLFIECKFAQQVWSLCLNRLGINLVQHNDPKTHCVSFHCVQANSKQNLVWKGIWAAIVRCIWDQRNFILFNQGVVDVEEIYQMAQLKVWLWLKYRTRLFDFTYADWILFLSCLYCLRVIGKHCLPLFFFTIDFLYVFRSLMFCLMSLLRSLFHWGGFCLLSTVSSLSLLSLCTVTADSIAVVAACPVSLFTTTVSFTHKVGGV